jgi:hypothetical protein
MKRIAFLPLKGSNMINLKPSNVKNGAGTMYDTLKLEAR